MILSQTVLLLDNQSWRKLLTSEITADTKFFFCFKPLSVIYCYVVLVLNKFCFPKVEEYLGSAILVGTNRLVSV